MKETFHLGRIGGTMIHPILGLDNPYDSPHSVYLKIIGESPKSEPNAVMQRGIDAEPIIAKSFGLFHPEFEVEEHGIVTHPKHEFLSGSPDRVLIDRDSGDLVAGLEIKTASLSTIREWGDEESDEVPEHYWCQCQWYAGLLQVPVWYLYVEFYDEKNRSRGNRQYIIDADSEVFEGMVSRCVEFWNSHVVPRIPPPITTADANSVRYYKRRYPAHDPGVWLDCDEATDRLCAALIEAQNRYKDAEKSFETLKLQMIAALGTCEGVKTNAANITYKKSKPSRRTDWKALAEYMRFEPDLIERFTTEQDGSRRFLITASK